MKNRIVYMFFVLAIVLNTACEKTEKVSPAELVGAWTVVEVQGNSYEVTITADPNNSSRFRIANFLDAANDPESTILNFMLVVSVEGSRLVILPQQVGVIEILNSNGVINSKNQFRIDYSYTENGRSNTNTAYFTRN